MLDDTHTGQDPGGWSLHANLQFVGLLDDQGLHSTAALTTAAWAVTEKAG